MYIISFFQADCTGYFFATLEHFPSSQVASSTLPIVAARDKTIQEKID